MKIDLGHEWNSALNAELDAPYFKKILNAYSSASHTDEIYPAESLIFNAFVQCPLSNLKVVIIGQDPYHGPSQAHGLSFSVPDGIKIPPSLKNIFKELKSDIPTFEIPNSGNLTAWAKQGVLLLNSILTVQKGLPGSHKDIGWQEFTDNVIKYISKEKKHVVFLLWGNFANSKATLIDQQKHLILNAAHPSPLARGAFFGNRHFSKTNSYLIQNKLSPVDWSSTQSTANLFS